MVNLLERLEESLAEEVTAKLLVRESKFSGEKGLLFIYRLILANHIDRPREYLIPCFIGAEGTPNGRISRWFAGQESLEASDLISGGLPGDREGIFRQAELLAEKQGEELFYQLSGEMEQKVWDVELKMQKYYADKEESIKRRVVVDNIREAKLRELEQGRAEKRRELERRRLLLPALERLQIAYVEFGD